MSAGERVQAGHEHGSPAGVRLPALTRELGNRLREHLRLDDVVAEASSALRDQLGADAVWVFLAGNGRPSSPVAGHYSPLLPDNYSETLPAGFLERLEGMYRRGETIVIDDLRGPEGDWVAPEIRGPLVAAGIITHLLIPFGVRDDMLGFITVERLEYRPWTPAEVRTVELVAGDIGRAVHDARLYEQEERLVAELRRVTQAKSDFLTAVSHELRTPLSSIAGYLEVVLDGEAGPLTPTQARMLGSVNRSTARLHRLIEDILTMSRIEAGAFRPTMRPVKLAEIVLAAAEAVRPDAGAKGVRLTAERSGDDLLVSGDADQLDQAVTNLLSNAVKFTAPGGQVRVSVAAGHAAPPSGQRMATVTVRDNGMGIPAADQQHLFGQFFRASNAVAQAVPGTGIGLTIVRSIVSSHHGTMDLHSREGEGTTVTIRLPVLSRQSP